MTSASASAKHPFLPHGRVSGYKSGLLVVLTIRTAKNNKVPLLYNNWQKIVKPANRLKIRSQDGKRKKERKKSERVV